MSNPNNFPWIRNGADVSFQSPGATGHLAITSPYGAYIQGPTGSMLVKGTDTFSKTQIDFDRFALTNSNGNTLEIKPYSTNFQLTTDGSSSLTIVSGGTPGAGTTPIDLWGSSLNFNGNPVGGGGVTDIQAGTGISLNQSTGSVTVTNNIVAGSGISLSTPYGNVIQIDNTGAPGPQGPQGDTGAAGGFINFTQIFENRPAQTTTGPSPGWNANTGSNTFTTYGGVCYFSISFSVQSNESFAGGPPNSYSFDIKIDGNIATTTILYIDTPNITVTIPSTFTIQNLSSGTHTLEIDIPYGITTDNIKNYANAVVQEVIGANSIGVTGPQGPQGRTGATGAQGSTGLRGATGATGAQGAQGNAGTAGATGLRGATGAQGAQGNAGTAGAAGAQGAQGNAGTAGAAGAQGAQGNAGTAGAAGAQGAQGNAGPGNSITTSTVTSSSSTLHYPILVTNTGAQTPFISNSATFALSYAPNTGTLNSQVINGASDIRIKQEIKPLLIDYTIEFLKKLNPVEYKFINDPTKKRFGLIAQEVEEVFKDENLGLYYKHINKDNEEEYYLSYLELISPIIKVVNNLVEKIDTLENKIKELEK